VKRAIFIVILVLVSCAPGGAEQLPIRTYTTADGLARDRVYKIVPDPRGYLWFCRSTRSNFTCVTSTKNCKSTLSPKP
jgi:hypothetical protein